jgi:hypothetical protein
MHWLPDGRQSPGGPRGCPAATQRDEESAGERTKTLQYIMSSKILVDSLISLWL